MAATVAAQGYFGPLSVDSMLTTSGDLVPVLEVNARVPPGLIALTLGAPLRMAFVRVRHDDFFERLVNALAEEKQLAVDGRPGILPPAASTLVPPRGWLFYAVFGQVEPQLPDILVNADLLPVN
ncbi:hypothetical protein ACIQGZ_10355 [Streptomyces sp. NPDC092296]|uniref:hypothetical protein n=1 Tax=Streptomyces sp. NPDC092296 TaxID=3366012 RepID=UPI003818B0BD